MSKVSEDIHHYIAGAGLYYGLSWIATFYPAAILGLFACQSCEPSSGGGPEFIGLIFMIIGYIVIQALVACEKHIAVAVIYLITLWPFLKLLKHCWDFAGDSDTFPLPPVDWWPLW